MFDEVPRHDRERFPPRELFSINAIPERIAPVELAPASVRSANESDLEALVNVELSAYLDVYGPNPPEVLVDSIREKYSDRIRRLGDWVRIMEHPDEGIIGMVVVCRTNMAKNDFIERDMTEPSGAEEAYDPHGRNAYVLNIAVIPGSKTGDGATLFTEAILRGIGEGIENVYFESRLPGFTPWLIEKVGLEAATLLSAEALDSHAQEYWQAKQAANDTGKELPLDKLLRYYVKNVNAEPLRLVKNAWQEDGPSRSYGVLCELKLPSNEQDAAAESPLEQVDMDDPAEALGLLRHAWGAVKAKKKRLLIASSLAATGYGLATNQVGDLVESVSHNAAWVVPSYASSLGLFFGSAAYILGAVGAQTRKPWKLKEYSGAIADNIIANQGVRGAFWINRVTGLGAAGVAAAGVVETLPPSAWSSLLLPALDVYGTLALGRVLLHAETPTSSAKLDLLPDTH